MGFGLQLLQVQSRPGKVADLHVLSRFPDKRKSVHVVNLGLQEDSGFCSEFSQLRRRSDGVRRAVLKRGGKSSGRVVGALGGSKSSGGLFWKPFWSNGGNPGGGLERGGGGGGDGVSGGRGGGGGGDGGRGSGEGGSGGFDSSGKGVYVSDFVEKEDDDEPNGGVVVRSPDLRAGALASLSSAAGDALDGEAPLGDLLLGRKKRAEESAPKVLSKASGKVSSVKENEREALVEEAAAKAAQLVQWSDGDEAPAKRSEIAILRRLQREAFSDLLRVRERLDKLEFFTGLRPSKTQSSFGDGGAKTRLKGEVCAGGAFVLLNDERSRQSRAALEQAGLHTGLDVRFTFETSYREKDVMITECSAGHSGSDGSILGGPVSVTKLVYNAQVTDDLNVVVAPLGARGNDVTETVNPLQGQALTQFARVGPTMFHHCMGSALGATLRGKTALVSLSQYLSGWGSGSSLSDGPVNSGPLCLSTLAHVMFQPWENSVFSISAVNRFWPSPPLPSFKGLHWSEMGPLVLSKAHHSHRSGSSSPQMSSPRDLRTSTDNTSMRDFRTSMDSTSMRDLRMSMDNTSMRDFRAASENPSGYTANASWGTPYGEPERGIITIPETQGSAQQSIAVAGEIDVGANVSLAGWAQADREYWLQDSENKEIEWGVSLTKPLGRTAGWGLCVGSSKVDLWGAARNDDDRFIGDGDILGEPCDMQLQMEAFLKLNMGRGFTLQPGVLYLLNKQSQTPALVLRSSWAL
ncbi:hypothetical protein KC19_4G155600 [Ceratodon purpureus]|uniref:Uncharacterized protein n=1 Tax=Ceratodon purpureus TaxID=3225 RepID=A0A8T0ICM7_CERPU|nr:hypothetical protein KC19_4G155600 [Ceratodon purpureus]